MCFELYTKMLEFNNDKLMEYLVYMKRISASYNSMRMGYYCSLCNADE